MKRKDGNKFRVIRLTGIPVSREGFILNSIVATIENGTEVALLYHSYVNKMEQPFPVLQHGLGATPKNPIKFIFFWPLITAFCKLGRTSFPRLTKFINEAAQWNHYGRIVGCATAMRYLLTAYRCWRFQPDVIHVHFGWHLEEGLRFARLFRIPLILAVHGNDVDKRWDWLPKLNDLFVRHIVSGSNNLKSGLIEKGIPDELAKRIIVVRNRVNPVFLAPPTAAPSDFIVVCIAALRAKKNHVWLLQALGLLQRQGYNFQCRLIGAPLSGGLRDKTNEQISELVIHERLKERVHFLGRLEPTEVRKEIDDASVVALTSYREGLPNCLIEGMARQRAIVASDIRGNREATRDGKYAQLVEIDNIEGLASALVEAHKITQRNDPKLIEEREYVIQTFSQEAHANALTEIYRSAIESLDNMTGAI